MTISFYNKYISMFQFIFINLLFHHYLYVLYFAVNLHKFDYYYSYYFLDDFHEYDCICCS